MDIRIEINSTYGIEFDLDELNGLTKEEIFTEHLQPIAILFSDRLADPNFLASLEVLV